MTASPDDRLIIIQMDPKLSHGGGAAPHSSASNITSPTTMQHTAAKVKVVQGCEFISQAVCHLSMLVVP